MPGVDGLTALPEIARNAPGATIVVFSEAIGDEEAALERGAHAVVHKSDSLELLVRVLKGSASAGGSSAPRPRAGARPRVDGRGSAPVDHRDDVRRAARARPGRPGRRHQPGGTADPRPHRPGGARAVRRRPRRLPARRQRQADPDDRGSCDPRAADEGGGARLRDGRRDAAPRAALAARERDSRHGRRRARR